LGACAACGTRLPVDGVRVELRKVVTVVFCDVVQSVALGDQLDPEVLREVMTRWYEKAAAVLTRHGGHKPSFIGDGVMSVFGIPRLREDDAFRAVSAAVELGPAVAKLSADLEAEFGPDVLLAVRTGVNTGVILVGAQVEGQEIALGDHVNVADRLQRAASPGQVLLGEETYRLVRHRVVAEPVAPLTLKGKSGPVHAWRLIAVRSDLPDRESRSDAPLVGRERELRLLAEVFDRAVVDRTCHLVTVLGEAGVGKTRLVREFLAGLGAAPPSIDDPPVTLLAGRCLDYGDGITFWPIAEMVRQSVGTTMNDPSGVVLGKLADLLSGEVDSELVVERIAPLLGRPALAAPTPEIPWAIRMLFETLARQRPLVVVVDDLQWGEPGLLELLEYLAESIQDRAVTLICLARPELFDRRAVWAGGKPNTLSLKLTLLPEAERDRLLTHLLGGRGIEHSARAHIVQAAGGHPFYLEELITMLIDKGELVCEDDRWVAAGDLTRISIPPSIHALLATRLDQLTPEERDVVQRASVIGEQFSHGALLALCSEPTRATLDDLLEALVRKELIRPNGRIDGDAQFRFRHLLIRDAAYDALPKRARTVLHEGFAEWVVRSFEATGGSEVEEIIGYHLERAYRSKVEIGSALAASSLAQRAAERLAVAGRRAADRDDGAAAAKLLTRAVELLPRGEPARLALLLELGEALTDIGELAQAAWTLSDAVDLAETAGDTALAVRCRLARARLDPMIEPQRRFEGYATLEEQAVTTFTPLRDGRGLAEGWLLRRDRHAYEGRYSEADPATQEALRHARASGSLRHEATALVYLAINAYWGPMPVPEAIERTERSLETLATRPSWAVPVLHSLCGLYTMACEFEQAERRKTRAEAISADLPGSRRHLPVSLVAAGDRLLRLGRPADAERMLRRFWPIVDRIGDKSRLALLLSQLAQALVAVGGRDGEAERLAQTNRATPWRDSTWTSMSWRSPLARVLARRGELEAAEHLINEAISMFDRTDILNVQGDLRMDLAQVLRLAGRADEATTALTGARLRYERKGNLLSAGAAQGSWPI